VTGRGDAGTVRAQRGDDVGPFEQSLPMPTDEEIMAARSAAGGWTLETLASWGVPWPPPAG